MRITRLKKTVTEFWFICIYGISNIFMGLQMTLSSSSTVLRWRSKISQWAIKTMSLVFVIEKIHIYKTINFTSVSTFHWFSWTLSSGIIKFAPIFLSRIPRSTSGVTKIQGLCGGKVCTLWEWILHDGVV